MPGMQQTHGAPLDHALRNTQKFRKPLLCTQEVTMVGSVQNDPSLSQGTAQISDSCNI